MPKLCPSCHHVPSGRIVDCSGHDVGRESYYASCYCQCHDLADTAPDLLAMCKLAREEITVLVPGRVADPILAKLEAVIAQAEGRS